VTVTVNFFRFLLELVVKLEPESPGAERRHLPEPFLYAQQKVYATRAYRGWGRGLGSGIKAS